MQVTHFDPAYPRTLYAAFVNDYIKGERHPDRIMPQHDFVYIVRGSWEITQQDETYMAEKDDVIILTANVHHGGTKLCSDGTKTMYIHTDAAPGEALCEGEGALPLGAIVHCAGAPEVKRGFERLVETFSFFDPLREYRLQTLFSELLISLADAQAAQTGGQDTDFVRSVCRLFQSDPHLFFTNRELAERFFISERTFVERFKKQTGLTPHKYQLEYKLKNICTMLLANPEMKLHELAINFGFYDEFHLSRTFKEAFGVSPSVYRKNGRI